jgi:hypothetical protein
MKPSTPAPDAVLAAMTAAVVIHMGHMIYSWFDKLTTNGTSTSSSRTVPRQERRAGSWATVERVGEGWE